MPWIRAFRAPAVAMVLLAALAGPAAAGEFRADEQVTIARAETVGEDLYIAAGNVTIDGSVEGDVTVAAGTVTVSGEISGSLNVAGGTVTVPGTIGGAVRAGAGNLTISGQVGRDVVVFGGMVTLESASRVAGDVAGSGGTLLLAGQVSGDVLAGAAEITISGSVGGSLDAAVEDLRVESGAEIGGDVTYVSERDATIAADASIGGEVTRRDPPEAAAGSALGDHPLLTYIGALLGLLVLGWGLLLLRPGLVVGSAAEVRTQPLFTFLIGLGVAFAQVILVIVLLVAGFALTVVADALGGAFILPAIVVSLLVVVLAYVSQVPVAMAVGQLLLLRVREGMSPYLGYAVGAALWAAILVAAGWLNGLLGALLWIIGWLIGLGAIAMHAWRTRNLVAVIPPRPPEPVWPTPAAPPAAAPPE